MKPNQRGASSALTLVWHTGQAPILTWRTCARGAAAEITCFALSVPDSVLASDADISI